MENRLPIYLPSINSYKHHALKLAIIDGNSDFRPWILSNFIQLYTPYNIKDNPLCDPHWLDFFLVSGADKEWLKIDNVSLATLKNLDLINYIKFQIDNGSYLYLYYDVFFIKHSKSYGQSHFPSNLLVYGYDDTKKVFYVYDYEYSNPNFGKLGRVTVEYKDLVRSIKHLKVGPFTWAENSQIYSPLVDSTQINIQLIELLLNDYLNSYPTYQRYYSDSFFENSLFGIGTYQILHYYCTQLKNGFIAKINILPFCILYEHKKMLHSLSKYLINNNHLDVELIESLRENEHKALNIRNLLIKMTMSNDTTLVNLIKNSLLSLEENEKIYIPRLILQLRKIK